MLYIDSSKTVSNILQNPLNEDIAQFDINTQYSVGDIIDYDNYVYKCIADSKGEYPNKSIKWIYWNRHNSTPSPYKYPNNKIACFDWYNQTRSFFDADVNVFEFENDFFDYIGSYSIYDIDSVEVSLVDKNSSNVVFYKKVELLENPVWDWYKWTIDELVKTKYSFVLKLPFYPNTKIIVKYNGKGSVGKLEIGKSIPIGCTLQGLTRVRKGAKTIKRDNDSGTMYISDRKIGGYLEITAKVKLDYWLVDDILEELDGLINKPLTFIVDDRDDFNVRKSTYSITGIFEDISNTLLNNSSTYNITIKSID